jgi:hypothetical protein
MAKFYRYKDHLNTSNNPPEDNFYDVDFIPWYNPDTRKNYKIAKDSKVKDVLSETVMRLVYKGKYLSCNCVKCQKDLLFSYFIDNDPTEDGKIKIYEELVANRLRPQEFNILKIGNQTLIDADSNICEACLKKPLNFAIYPSNNFLKVSYLDLVNSVVVRNDVIKGHNLTIDGLATIYERKNEKQSYIFNIENIKVGDIIDLKLQYEGQIVNYHIKLVDSYWTPLYGYLFERNLKIRKELFMLQLCLNRIGSIVSKDIILYIGRFLTY